MVIDRYHPLWGGTENQLRRIIPHLKDKGCQILVITRRWDASLKRKETIEGTIVYRVGLPGRSITATLSYVLSVFLTLLKERRSYEIIHTNGVAALGILGRLCGAVLRKRTVARMSSAGKVYELAKKNYSFLALPIFRRIDALVSLSKDITSELRAHGVDQGRIWEISNGVDCTKFRRLSDQARQSWLSDHNLPLDAVLVVYASLFKDGKGHETLLKSWRLVEREHNNCWLILVGDGNFQDPMVSERIMQTYHQENLSRVIFTGATEDPAQFTGIGDICSFAAEDDTEGCPNTLLEAMASELTPVAFDAKGVRDFITHEQNGLLLPSKTAESLAKGLLRLIVNDDQRKRFGRRAREVVFTNNDFSVIAENYMNLYQTLLKQT